MKDDITPRIRQYAKKILDEHNVPLTSYWGVNGETIISDLKEAYPDGMEYPYIDVANTIMKISTPTLIKRHPYQMVWNTDSCCDGAGYDSLIEAKESAIDTLVEWMVESQYDWKIKMDNNGGEIGYAPTKQQIEDFNYMIYSCYVEVQKYNPDTDEYEEYWSPSEEDENEIGWRPYIK